MKIYARMRQENEDDELIVFEIELPRLQRLLDIAQNEQLAEATIAMPAFERIPWPEHAPTDGFVSQETQDEWVAGAFEDLTPSAELDQSLLSQLHVGANGAVHVELRGGPAGEWWSEGFNLEEMEQNQ